jgi:membrane protein implicated in regulation of membrane protease activity
LLLFILVYWLIVIIGLIDTDFFDVDIDVDGDGDIDIDGSADISWINNVLTFFNLGKIPLMIWLSFVVFPTWFICVNITGFLGISNFFVGLLIFLPALIASMFLAKFLTWPFVRFFQKIDEDSKEKEIIGQVGTVVLPATHTSKGQAEVNYKGSFLRFYIVTSKNERVEKGQRVLFIQQLKNEGTFLVEPFTEL